MTEERQQASQGDPRVFKYDPAFRAAVEDGCLTAAQALQRGRRDTCASRLATKHGLTLEIAFAVADNRLALSQAIRKQRSPAGDPVARRERARSIGVGWAALGVPLVLFLGVFAWHLSLTAHSSGAELSAPSVQTDAEGRVTRVAAGDPKTVLEAYCAATTSEAACKPAGLMKAARVGSGLRVGVFVDPAAAERLLAIPIRKSESTGLWFAGDGESPLNGLLAPHNAAATLEREESGAGPTEALTR